MNKLKRRKRMEQVKEREIVYATIDVTSLADELAIGAFMIETAGIKTETLYNEQGELADKVARELMEKLRDQYKRVILQFKKVE